MRAQERPAASKASRVSRMTASRLQDARVHGGLVAAAVAGVAGDAWTSTCGSRARPSATATAPAGVRWPVVQAHVELDQQRRPRAVAPERGRQPLGGGDAVDGDGQLDAVGGDARQPVALLGPERRVVDEERGAPAS